MIVQLQYYKKSGKWYSSAEFEWEGPDDVILYNLWDAVRHMNPHPGLACKWDGIISVRVPDHPDDHPHLIVPKEKDKEKEINLYTNLEGHKRDDTFWQSEKGWFGVDETTKTRSAYIQAPCEKGDLLEVVDVEPEKTNGKWQWKISVKEKK